MRVYTILFSLIFVNQLCFSQSVKKLKNHGELAMSVGNYYGAIDEYSEAFKKDSSAEISYLIGECYLEVRDYKNAKIWFEESIKINPKEKPQSEYYLATLLQKEGKLDEANELYKKLSLRYKGENKRFYRFMAKKGVQDISFIKSDASKNEEHISIKHLEKPINGENSDLSPWLKSNNELVFSSLKVDSLITAKNAKEDTNFITFYKANLETNEVKPYDIFPNDKKHHYGNLVFNITNDKAFFNKCYIDGDGEMICQIYTSDLTGDKWSEPEKLNNKINLSGYTNTQPTIQNLKEGVDILYFSSNRPEGKGDKDIWYVMINNGVYSEPKNCGSKINTMGDEITPYYDNKKKYFYFSTNAKTGFGGFDIFKTKGYKNRWSVVNNMGSPINTSLDDFSFVNGTSEISYLVSNRPESYFVNHSMCCDDIFEVHWLDRVHLYSKLNIFEDSTNIKLEDYTVIVERLEDNHYDTINVFENLKNTDSLVLEFEHDKDYEIVVMKKDYITNNIHISTHDIAESDTITSDIPLKKIRKQEIINLDNIYFEFDKDIIKEKSKRELMRMVNFMKANPQVKIEIGAHTDSKGDDLYNLKLSQKRAKKVLQFMIQNGIKSTRMTHKGYGETNPLLPNENPDGTDNEENRKLNRRVELIIFDF